MSPEDQYAARSCFEVENKIDEMFRVVEMKFQPRDGSPDSNGLLMVSAGALKELRYSDNFRKSFIFNVLQMSWWGRIASDQLA